MLAVAPDASSSVSAETQRLCQPEARRPCRKAAAPTVYFDTWALAKLLLEEEGSELADAPWTQSRVRATWRLAYPQARAAFAAAHRAGRLDGRALLRVVLDLDDLLSASMVSDIDAQLARTAGQLAERHALRGYDAVHLATALSVAHDRLVVTWDTDLAQAALTAGLAVTPTSGRAPW